MEVSELRDSGRNGREYRTPAARILEAAIAVADTDAEDDLAWHRNWTRLRKTLLDLGWTPPQDRDPGIPPPGIGALD